MTGGGGEYGEKAKEKKNEYRLYSCTLIQQYIYVYIYMHSDGRQAPVCIIVVVGRGVALEIRPGGS